MARLYTHRTMTRQARAAVKLARAQGLFNVVGGAWPLASLKSFEWVYGDKTDVFLQKTVGALLVSIGCVQMTADDSKESLQVARRLGIATALTLLLIDLVYIPKGEMRKTYLQDVVCEAGWIAAWLRTKP
jgi:hypothetical protein